MNTLLHNNIARAAFLITVFVLLAGFGLWSWNTLAELFNAPQAQYKHAVAALSLLAITRLFLYQQRAKCEHGLHHAQTNP